MGPVTQCADWGIPAKPPSCSPEAHNGASGVAVSRLFLVVVACLLLGAVAPVPAPAQAPATTPPPHQFIFVLETSRAMQRRVPGMLAVAKDLLDSKFTGQLRPGDLVGVWAYNQDLRTNELEPEEWSAGVSVRVLNRIQAQRYDRRAAPDTVLPLVTKAMSQLTRSTMILLSSGEGTISGTAFDSQINDAWQRWRDDQAKARQPMVTVIRAQDGAFTGWTVTPAPWPIELPPLRPEPARQVTLAARSTSLPDTLVTPRATLPASVVSTNAPRPAPPARTNTIAAAAPRPSALDPAPATLPPTQAVARVAVPISPVPATNSKPPAATAPLTRSQPPTMTVVRAREADPTATGAGVQAAALSTTRTSAPAASAPSIASNTNAPPPSPTPKAESPRPAPASAQPVTQAPVPETSASPVAAPSPPAVTPTDSAPVIVVAAPAQRSTQPRGFWRENKLVVIILGASVLLAVWFFWLWLRTFRRPVQDLSPEVFRQPAAPEQKRIADQAGVPPGEPKTEP